VTYVGATPVFADVDAHTWCLSSESFVACITPRTKAVIPVDVYGGMADYPALREIAARHGIAIIEDAAEAVGAELGGRRAGAWGDTSVFSFHGSKVLTTGEGGLLATDRDDLVRRALHLRDHGREPGDRYFFNTEVGFKYRMSAMQAALGTAQLERVEELVARKREIFHWYRAELAGVAGVTLNHEPAGTRNTYWMVSLVLDPQFRLEKRELQDRFAAENIDTRPFFHPLSSLPAYRDWPQAKVARERNRIAYAISPWALNLPSALNLTPAQVKRVCDTLKRFMRGPGVKE
jgi:perosamine synthetase